MGKVKLFTVNVFTHFLKNILRHVLGCWRWNSGHHKKSVQTLCRTCKMLIIVNLSHKQLIFWNEKICYGIFHVI